METTINRRREICLVVILIALGTFLRTYHLSSIPRGLHRDEMMEAYEAFSLLKTGADRWGNHWPAYFVSWGSGQNVLQSYLSIPVVAALGLSATSARFIPALFGVLLLPLFYLVLRNWYGFRPALVALFILVFSPWQIMLSRIGIENNQLPFLILLGLYAIDRALLTRSRLLILVALLPFAGALYSYGIFVTILPGLMLLLLLARLQRLKQDWKLWACSASIFAAAASPIGLFVLKNYIVKHDFAFERGLPLTVPYMRISRLAQAREETGPNGFLAHNAWFVRHGLRDQALPWFSIPPRPPLPFIVLLLSVVGIAFACIRFARHRRIDGYFSIWLLACLPIFFLFPLNISRSVAIYLPLIAFAGRGFVGLQERLQGLKLQASFAFCCFLFFVGPIYSFSHRYYGKFYGDLVSPDFRPEMPKALDRLNELSGNRMPMYVTNRTWLTYVDVLFYRRVDPRSYQMSGATWWNPDFGWYRFNYGDDFKTNKPFAYLLLAGEDSICSKPTKVEQIGQFVVGACNSPGSYSLPLPPSDHNPATHWGRIGEEPNPARK